MADQIVISGIGLASRFGFGVDPYWRAATRGPADALSTAWPSPGELTAVSLVEKGLPAAVCEAFGTRKPSARGDRWLVVNAGHRHDAAAEQLSDALGDWVQEPEPVTVSHACASVGFAISLAEAMLSADETDHVVIAGRCVPTATDVGGMKALRTLASVQVRPFHAERDGTLLGVGAGALVVESASSAAAAGVTPLARVIGSDCRVGAEKGAGLSHDSARRCLDTALEMAANPVISSVQAHATGTVEGDAAELRLLHEALGERGDHVAGVASHKGLLGHFMHVAMLPSVVNAIQGFRTRLVPGTAGLETARDEHRLRLMAGTEVVEPGPTLVLGFGFGDNNAALVLAPWEMGAVKWRT